MGESADLLIGISTVVVVCVLVMVLGIQLQIRNMSHKIDDILKKLA